MATNTTGVTQQEAHDAFEQLYYALDDAYWAASTIQDKDRIRGIQSVVFEILTQLNQADITSRTADFKALAGTFTSIQKKLQDLQSDVDTIIHATQIASKVVNATVQVLSVAARFFPL